VNERRRRRLPEGCQLLFGLGERGWWRGRHHFEGQGLGRVGADCTRGNEAEFVSIFSKRRETNRMDWIVLEKMISLYESRSKLLYPP